MQDEKEKDLTHGFEIHAGDHHNALKYITSHMNEQQLKDMVYVAKSGHGADFQVNHGGQHSNYKLVHEGGKLVIHPVHHSI